MTLDNYVFPDLTQGNILNRVQEANKFLADYLVNIVQAMNQSQLVSEEALNLFREAYYHAVQNIPEVPLMVEQSYNRLIINSVINPSGFANEIENLAELTITDEQRKCINQIKKTN